MSANKDKWNRWHPIARSIAQRLVQRDDPNLTDEELAEVKESLVKLFYKPELELAVRDVLLLAAALEHEGQIEIASKLFVMIETKVVIGALDRINHVRAIDRAELVASRAKRFASFSRSDSSPRLASEPKERGLRLCDLRPIHVMG
jgi:hypothetical protein